MFNETRLLDDVAYGSHFGQEFNTRITALRSGQERRNANWTRPLGRYSVSYTALYPEDHLLVRGAHMASMGSAIAFRFKDWIDYEADREQIGYATGVEQQVQLTKTYKFGPLNLLRPISKPVAGTVTIYADGQVMPMAVVDYAKGIVTVTAPVEAVLTWSGEFDVPVRFASDRLDFSPVAPGDEGFMLGADVDLVEVPT
jgi:uncharacterized protein (TIGR02217 family)